VTSAAVTAAAAAALDRSGTQLDAMVMQALVFSCSSSSKPAGACRRLLPV
jgi:hypothetical protein